MNYILIEICCLIKDEKHIESFFNLIKKCSVFYGTELVVSVVSQSRETVLLKKNLKAALASLEDAVCKYFYDALYLIIESCSYVDTCFSC